MAEVIVFPGCTTLPLPVARVLENAKGCAQVLVLGEEPDGTLSVASSTADGPTLLWWLEKVRHKLLNGDYAGG
jgi:hypothetical protein